MKSVEEIINRVELDVRLDIVNNTDYWKVYRIAYTVMQMTVVNFTYNVNHHIGEVLNETSIRSDME